MGKGGIEGERMKHRGGGKTGKGERGREGEGVHHKTILWIHKTFLVCQ